MSNNELTIVINTFKSEEKIHNCLNSVNIDQKVIVVENSDNENFKKQIEKKYSNVQCILTGENLGYAKGNNLGLSQVKTKYALILNPDASLEEDTLKNFLHSANKIKDFSIIGPAKQDELSSHDKNEDRNEIFEVENLKGFAMFLNLTEFKDIGFFDENFFIYFEEIDLCKRLINNNKKIYLDTNIKITHAGGTSHEESINYEMEKSRNWHWMWSSFYFHKKHNGYIVALIKILPKFMSSMVKMIFYRLISNNEKKDIYTSRYNGILNSILMKKSWYRPKIN